MTVGGAWRTLRETLWSADAAVLVLLYTALILLIPTRSPKWKRPT